MLTALTEQQRYLFDTMGYIVIENLLTTQQIELLRSTLRHSTEQFPPVPQTEGPLHWHPIWRDLLDLPGLSPILEELVGNPALLAARQAQGQKHDHEHEQEQEQEQDRIVLPTFRLDHINVHTHIANGFKGGKLHGGWSSVAGMYRCHNGRIYNGLTTVSFELFDTHPMTVVSPALPGRTNRT